MQKHETNFPPIAISMALFEMNAVARRDSEELFTEATIWARAGTLRDLLVLRITPFAISLSWAGMGSCITFLTSQLEENDRMRLCAESHDSV